MARSDRHWHRGKSLWASVALMAFMGLPAGVASASEKVDVIDAGDVDDPFDAIFDIGYKRSLRRAKITREFNCAHGLDIPAHANTCPTAPRQGVLLHVKELRYQRTTHEVVPRARFGLWHDLELSIEAPVVLSDTQEVRFAGNGGDPNSTTITAAESSIAPENQENLFEVEDSDLPVRGGFGDMLFKIRYAPISQERDDQRATWALELGYRAPTGKPMKYLNEEVGRGVHELIVGTSLGRRFAFADPYVQFEGVLPIPAENSLFQDYGNGQQFVGPGPRVSFAFGSEFVPYEDPQAGSKFFIDIGFGGTFQAKGRDYSELFDALASGQATCDPSANDADPAMDRRGRENCAVYNPDGREDLANQPHDGITTVEEFVTFRAHLGMGAYMTENAKFTAGVSIAHDTEHYLSSADVGRDVDGSGLVECGPSCGFSSVPDENGVGGYRVEEHNPTYVPAIDAQGRRIRVEETTIFQVGVGLSMMF